MKWNRPADKKSKGALSDTLLSGSKNQHNPYTLVHAPVFLNICFVSQDKDPVHLIHFRIAVFPEIEIDVNRVRFTNKHDLHLSFLFFQDILVI